MVTSEKGGDQYKLGQSRIEHDLRGSCMQELVEDCAGEMQQSLKGHLLTVRGENALNIKLSTANNGRRYTPWLRFQQPAARTCSDVVTRCPCFWLVVMQRDRLTGLEARRGCACRRACLGSWMVEV